VDPALHAHLHRELGWSLDVIDEELNRESGLKGLSGVNDFRELVRRVGQGNEPARLAFDVYCYRAKKYVGAYLAALGRLDAVVFTGGVGEHSADARRGILEGLAGLGIRLDPRANEADDPAPRVVSPPDSTVAVLVVPTNEEWEIARQSLSVVRGGDAAPEGPARRGARRGGRTGATPTA
jgi:acetate kinase